MEKKGDNMLEPAQLFLSYKKPHEPVTKPTLARWLKSVLDSAGIDISLYKAHSTRAASTSKAGMAGIRLEEIVKQGNWSSSSTFERYYRKPIDSCEKSIQEAILSG